jgi:hypothetical protein
LDATAPIPQRAGRVRNIPRAHNGRHSPVSDERNVTRVLADWHAPNVPESRGKHKIIVRTRKTHASAASSNRLRSPPHGSTHQTNKHTHVERPRKKGGNILSMGKLSCYVRRRTHEGVCLFWSTPTGIQQKRKSKHGQTNPSVASFLPPHPPIRAISINRSSPHKWA